MSDNIDDFFSDAATNKDEQIADLQRDLDSERDARREDRFLFLVILILFFNIMIFTVMPNLGGPLAVLILELIILIPIARRMGIQESAKILDRAIGGFVGTLRSGD